MTTTVGTERDNQIAKITQIDAKSSQESSNIISKDEWLIYIENYKVDKTTKKPQIERVPSLLRQNNSHKNCYDPLLVSIGPYHHGKPELQAFEKLKIPIAQKFWRACFNQVSMSQLYEEVEKVGRSARECYEKGSTEGYDDELFNKMMFLDACFVLHTMFCVAGQNVYNGEVEELIEVDVKLYKSQIPVLEDLLLLENQIPLLVLKVLMNFRLESKSQKDFIQAFIECITIMPADHKNTRTNVDEELDLDANPHLLHLMWEQLTMHENKVKTKYDSSSWGSDRSVTELKSAGIHFKPSQTGSVTNIEFKSHLTFGTLTLPRINVVDSTKSLLLNLVAYEMCPYGPSESHITSYICLMGSLIDTDDDVKELKKKRIIFNDLSSDEQLVQLFNEIPTNLPYENYIHGHTLREIDNHCKNKGYVWMAEWANKYFSSPWALVAFLGAVFTVALTSVGTFFTIFSCKT